MKDEVLIIVARSRTTEGLLHRENNEYHVVVAMEEAKKDSRKRQKGTSYP